MLLCALLLSNFCWAQKTLQLKSPDEKTELSVIIDDELKIAIRHNGTEVLQASPIGLDVRGAGVLGDNPKLKGTKRRTVSEEVTSPFYIKGKVSNTYNELTATFKGNYAVEFRCYDQGVGYRFVTTLKGKEVIVNNEKALYNFPQETTAYAAYANRGKDDNLESQYSNSFENRYNHKKLTELNSKRLIFFPFLAELPQSPLKVCITETDLQDYPGMFLLSNPEKMSMKGVWAPLPSETKQGGHNELQQNVVTRHDYIARTTGKRSYPWRVFAISEQDGDLLNNDLAYLMSEPSKVQEIDWIKPGKVAWEWWNNWNITGVPFRAGINNETYKYYIDFASKNGIEYVILDEGWAVNKKADLFQVIPQINLPELVSYAESKNVGIILWAGYWAFHRDMEKVVKHYADMGVKGFKIDFLDRDDQDMIRFMWEAAELCARHHMLIDYHGVCKPFGVQRTYPNVLNFEGVSGLEQMKWASKDYDQVIYDLQFPFIRMLAGPVDYTQGAMRNAIRRSYTPNYSEPMSQGTRCRQLAEYIVFNSPFNMLCDSPTLYMKEQECTDFIASVPTVWDETRVLPCSISEYINLARRSGDVWYVGGINDWKTREVEIDLSFLPEGTYTIERFVDGINADRNAADYCKEQSTLQGRKLNVKMYPGGGYVLKIQKQK